MNKKHINIITYLLTFGLCGFLIWFSVKDVTAEQVEKIKFAIKHARYMLLFPVMLMGFVSHWSRAVRWTYLMEPLEMYPSKINTFLAVMIGYIANLGIPRFGEVLKCSLLSKYENLPTDKLIGTIIAERAFDMLCLGIIFIITFVVQIDFSLNYLNAFWAKLNQNPSGDHTFQYMLIGTLLFLFILFKIFKKRLINLPIFKKLEGIFKNIIAGIMSFKTMKNKRWFVFHTLIIWGMYLGMIVIGFKSIHETDMLGIKTGFSVLSFGSIGIIATPGGLGAYPLIVGEIVQLYGVDETFSFAISWIIWLIPTLIVILGGATSLIILPIYNRNKNAE